MDLKQMKVKDILQTDDYRRRMEEQLQREEDSQKRAALRVRNMGGRLKRCPLDSLREKGVLNAPDMTRLFKSVMNHDLVGFSSTERSYIYDIGVKVFRQVMTEYQKQKGGNDGAGEKEV